MGLEKIMLENTPTLYKIVGLADYNKLSVFIGEEEAEPGGGVKRVISLASLHCHIQSKFTHTLQILLTLM